MYFKRLKGFEMKTHFDKIKEFITLRLPNAKCCKATFVVHQKQHLN